MSRMDLERERRLAELLGGALGVAAEGRIAYLEGQCDDSSLRAKVIALLEGDDGGTAFFERPAAMALQLSAALDPRQSPERIGEYRIEEVIGEGGMGIVYVAHQSQPVDRRVAIKLMRTVLAGPQERARFDTERQAMARLAHPNIAQMYEAGTTDDGRPYVVMEFVDGQPVTTYCDQRSLRIRARLRIFVGICRAVEHAHRRQLLHRDLKPSNVLVSESQGLGVPKVIDFGIAKVLDEDFTRMTVQGVLGTPAYMSPEAIAGDDLDTRADVYSLGVLLYELLCGERPFDGAGTNPVELLRRVQEEEPTRPSRRVSVAADDDSTDTARTRGATTRELQVALETDLDWIVLKALAKDREGRYGSAAELAADVARFLDDEPIEARPPSLGYKMRKWSRRHRGAVAAGSFAILALVAGFVVRSIEARRAREAAERAQLAAREVQEVSAFLVTLMGEADPENAQGEEVTVRQVLDRGAERLKHELADQPLVRARLLHAVADVYANLALLDAATEAYESAIEIRRSAPRRDDVELGRVLNDAGWAYYRQRRYEPAERVLREATTLFGTESDGAEQALSTSLNLQAIIAADLGDTARAENLYRQSIAILEGMNEPDEADLANRLNNLAILYVNSSRFEEAEALYERTIGIRMRLLGEKHPKTATSFHNVGVLNWFRAEYAAAEEQLARGQRLREEVLGSDHPDTAASASTLAHVYLETGRLDLAAELAQRALEVEEASFGSAHQIVHLTLTRRAKVHQAVGETEAAREAFLRAFAIHEEIPSVDAMVVTMGLAAYAELELAEGRVELAESYAERAVAAAEALPSGSPTRLDAYLTQARVALERDPADPDAPRAILERAAAEADAGSLPGHPSVASVHGLLAALYGDTGRPEAAEVSYRQALEVASRYRSIGHPVATAVADEAESFLAARTASSP